MLFNFEFGANEKRRRRKKEWERGASYGKLIGQATRWMGIRDKGKGREGGRVHRPTNTNTPVTATKQGR